MTDIIAISGSLRKGSFNTALLNAAERMFPDHIQAASINGIPLYNADFEESQGIPAVVVDLKDRIAGADGLLIATPEYNNSMPGVLKNAVDWLSRPADDIPRVFHGKPVAVIGASPGGFGTILAQSAWLPVLRTLKTRPWYGGRLMVSRVSNLVDDDGVLTDKDTREKVEKFVRGFIEFCAE
jgi:NAD(P)H-dependent FMN reductase